MLVHYKTDRIHVYAKTCDKIQDTVQRWRVLESDSESPAVCFSTHELCQLISVISPSYLAEELC
uniref:Uncharacterized protein n=1 Tax=Anguilla anguilla TaxID=7936 RepID=A0A0E9QSM0_ANGAN